MSLTVIIIIIIIDILDKDAIVTKCRQLVGVIYGEDYAKLI